MESKKPWQSRMMVVNAVLGIIAAVSLFLPQAAVAKTFIDSHGAEIAMVWGILNTVLRAVTKDKIVLGD